MRFKRHIVCILVLLTVIGGLTGCVFEKNIEICSHSDENGKYTVVLYQVGSPQWSFGPVKSKLVLKDSSGKVIDEESFSLGNDGAGVYPGNIEEIIWHEDSVVVRMNEADTTRVHNFTLFFDK